MRNRHIPTSTDPSRVGELLRASCDQLNCLHGQESENNAMWMTNAPPSWVQKHVWVNNTVTGTCWTPTAIPR